jgi:signal transduction histidine kinase
MDPLPLVSFLVALGLAGYFWWSGRRRSAEHARLRDDLTAQGAALAEARRDLKVAQGDLRAKREQLVRARQLASLGYLTGGIAHEIKNPLNFVNNFARLSAEMARELKETLEERRDDPVRDVVDEVGDLLDDIAHNAEKIVEHGARADATVRNMLLHARSNADQRQPTDLNKLFSDYATLAYHGMRAADPHFNATLTRDLDPAVGEVEVVPQDMGRVFINLLNNAFYAVHEKKQSVDDPAYEPTVTIQSVAQKGEVALHVIDNGPGIPEDQRARVFEPFFTTKPAGAGTGLGLSLSYESVTQGHGGTMDAVTRDEGAEFVIVLPRTPTEDRDG